MKELNKKAKEEESKSKNVLGDESEHGCEVSVCVLACVPCVLTQTWPVYMMFFKIFSVLQFEVNVSQTCSFSKARHQCHIGTRAAQEIESRHGKTTSRGARGGEEQIHAAKCAVQGCALNA